LTVAPAATADRNSAVSEEPHKFSRIAENLVRDFRGIPDTDPPGMHSRPIKPMSSLVDALLVKYQLGRPSCEHLIREQWPDVVGPANAAYSHPLRIDRGCSLLVLVSHGVVRNELFLHRDAIVAKLQKLPGCDHVKEIRLRAG